MHTTQTHETRSASFARRFVRAIFGARNALAGAYASACANELRSHRDLTMLIAGLVGLSRRQRAVRLMEAAVTLRARRETAGVADTLCRMAKRPALFRAVSRALQANPPGNVAHFPAELSAAQAA